MSLALRIREYWRALTRGRPGHRFQDQYERTAKARNGEHLAWRIAKVAGGIVALAIGVIEIVLPGPAVLFFFLGGALLATQSRTIARAMDWTELRVRRVWSFVRRKVHRHRHAAMFFAVAAATLAAVAVYAVRCA